MRDSDHDLNRFEAARPRLEAIAYRMLGSAGDAEDAVQETFLRWHGATRELIEVPQAWWTQTLTNLCLNQLNSARVRRETYVGTWLPEPLLDGDPMLGPPEAVEQRESVSYAVMVLLERLSPLERAVYVLREAFEYSHAEIAGILGVSEPNSQQLLHRAKAHLDDDSRGARLVDASAARGISHAFLSAVSDGRIEPLVQMLTADAVSTSDGGGTIPARSLILGAQQIASFLVRMMKPSEAKRKIAGGDVVEWHAAAVNGGPGLVATVDDRIMCMTALELSVDEVPAITALRNQMNPVKLDRATRRWSRSEHSSAAVSISLRA